MNKFKVGDAVMCISDYGQISRGECYKVVLCDCDTVMIEVWGKLVKFPAGTFELAHYTLPEPVPHPHADKILEWAKNPKPKWQHRNKDGGDWITCLGNPSWNEDLEYRQLPDREFPVTSLLTNELWLIYNKSPTNDCIKDVANAAIRQYILDSEK